MALWQVFLMTQVMCVMSWWEYPLPEADLPECMLRLHSLLEPVPLARVLQVEDLPSEPERRVQATLEAIAVM
jgi:hypothetical protein